MNSVCKSFHFRHFFQIFAGLLIFLVGFWPMPGWGHQAGEFYHQAIQAIQDKNLPQAKSFLEQAIKEYPEYPRAHHLLGVVQFQLTQDPNKGIPSLKRAIQLNENLAQAHYDLGLLLLRQEQMAEAQEAIQHALTLYPRFWEARLTLAKTFDQTGATDKAIQEYETVLTQEPFASEALFHLAHHMMQKNQPDRAQDLLTRLTTHDPQHSEGWYLRGRISEQSQQFDQAIEAYQQVLQNDQEHADTHYNLGFLYQQKDQPQKAIEHFQRVTQLQPTDVEAYVNLAVLLVGEKRFDKAEEVYQKAIELQPDSLEGQFNMGAFYEFHKEDLQKAKHHYQQYLDLGGSDKRIQELMKE